MGVLQERASCVCACSRVMAVGVKASGRMDVGAISQVQRTGCALDCA